MCRQVKSIEIIEFGYEKSEEGVNGAKSEYCVDKHKINITRPYQAALREATGSTHRGRRPARALRPVDAGASPSLKWQRGEDDDDVQGARRAGRTKRSTSRRAPCAPRLRGAQPDRGARAAAPAAGSGKR